MKADLHRRCDYVTLVVAMDTVPLQEDTDGHIHDQMGPL